MTKFLTPQEMANLPVGQKFVFDIEVFKNYLLVAFKRLNTNEYVIFEAHDNGTLHLPSLNWFIRRHKLYGFNSNAFDLPILTYALTGANTSQVKEVCNRIIHDNIRQFDFYSEFKLDKLRLAHSDIIGICPLDGSLEAYGANLHAKSIQPMPVDPETFLTPEQKASVGWYCLKDLDITELLVNNLESQLILRENMSKQYGIDLMSASDAQIAEKVIRSEVGHVLGKVPKSKVHPGDLFDYEPPAWVFFTTPQLQTLLEDIEDSVFRVGPGGHPEAPETLQKRTVTIGRNTYTVGLGGLHSTEKSQAVIPRDGGFLLDIDVASYYPAIILNNEFAPDHLGKTFLKVYQDLVDRRLEAKKIKHPDADSLKIVINGTYGKFGDKFSCVYSPKNVTQVTLTGQLALLMLIEHVEVELGIQVVSANTDGIVFNLRDSEELSRLRESVKRWNAHTSLETEETFYKALYSRDVNNYIAIKVDPSAKPKTKGTYLQPEGIFRFHKNPDCNIVSKAICEYITKQTPVAETILKCQDIREFIIARQARGGATFNGEYVGKFVRWYYSRYSKSTIVYKNSGNTVSKSEGAMPIPVLPDQFPPDVDFDKYIELAEKGLLLIGAVTAFDRQSKIFQDGELD